MNYYDNSMRVHQGRVLQAQAGRLDTLQVQGVRSDHLDRFEEFLIASSTLIQPSLIVRLKIRKGSYSLSTVVDKPLSHGRLLSAFIPYLDRLVHRLTLDVDCFVLVSDTIHVAEAHAQEFADRLKQVPFLRCDSRPGDLGSASSILIPDYFLQGESYAREWQMVRRKAGSRSLHQRHNRIIWRGSLSGPDYPTRSSCASFPRFRLLRLSQQFPAQVDARLTNHELVSPEDLGVLQRYLEDQFGQPADCVPPETLAEYKYAISLDGAVAAWKRVPLILASGSVLLLQHHWSQFFYAALVPWAHYVPVDDELRNLLPVYRLLEDCPQLTESLGRNGTLVAEAVLNPAFIEEFFVRTLQMVAERL